MKNDISNLIKKAQRGDCDSFAEIYESVYGELYRFALYTLCRHEDAADAVAETVLDAWSALGSLRSPEAFRGWIFRILANKCRAFQRQYVSDRQQLSDNELTEELLYLRASSEPDLAESAAVRDAFFRLPETDRMILSLHLFAGLKSREIAVLLSMNPSTVRSREKRALATLRKELCYE